MEDCQLVECQPIHASCVAIGDRGLLIIGPSCSGKSSLALELMSRGAKLVADDRVMLELVDDRLKASSPKAIAGKIEAREVGILKADNLPYVFVDALVNLAKTETQRLPEVHSHKILGLELPCYYKSNTPFFPAALMQLLKAGRYA